VEYADDMRLLAKCMEDMLHYTEFLAEEGQKLRLTVDSRKKKVIRLEFPI